MQLHLQALVFSTFESQIHSPLHQLPPPPAATTDFGIQRLTGLHVFDSNQITSIGFFMATGTISWEPIPSSILREIEDSPTRIRVSPSMSSEYLNILPESMLVMAWFEDLLLVYPSISSKDFNLCNPLTQQWHLLPLAPRIEMQIGNGVRYFERFSLVGLVCKPNSHDVGHRAVLIYLFGEDYDSYRALIFSSETQKWIESVVKIPQPPPEVRFSYIHPWNNGGVVGCDGVLYWLSDVAPTFSRCAIIALNPFKGTDDKNQWRFIDPPADLYPLLKINLTSWGSPFKWSVNLFLGACQGRLRLARLPVKESDGIEVLRVWEMKDHSDNGTSTYSWHVVHEVCIEGKDKTYFGI